MPKAHVANLTYPNESHRLLWKLLISKPVPLQTDSSSWQTWMYLGANSKSYPAIKRWIWLADRDELPTITHMRRELVYCRINSIPVPEIPSHLLEPSTHQPV